MVNVTQNYVQNSPVVQALNNAFDHDANFDLRASIRYDTCPIEKVRLDAEFIGLGVHTTLFGEAFERKVLQNAWYFCNNRNRPEGMNLYARLLQISYDETFILTGALPYQKRDSIDLCITAVLGTGLPNAEIQSEVTRALSWLLNRWGDDNKLTVQFCTIGDSQIYVGVGTYYRVEYNVEVS